MKPKNPNNLKFYRQQKECLTQAKLASMVGITEQHYQKLEYGNVKPKFDTLRRLAKALNVSESDLFPLPEEEKTTSVL